MISNIEEKAGTYYINFSIDDYVNDQIKKRLHSILSNFEIWLTVNNYYFDTAGNQYLINNNYYNLADAVDYYLTNAFFSPFNLEKIQREQNNEN